MESPLCFGFSGLAHQKYQAQTGANPESKGRRYYTLGILRYIKIYWCFIL